MFDCCSKTYSRVDANLGLARAFALVGLLRLVDDSVPKDLIYTYLHNTDQSGLYSSVKYELLGMYGYRVHGNQGAGVESQTNSDRVDRCIPTGLASMAKEYFVRCYWDQIRYVMANVINAGNSNGAPRFVEQEDTYPAFVRTALDALVIPFHAELKEIRHSVHTLYAAIMPTGGSVGEGITPWTDKETPGNYNILTLSQLRKIDALYEAASKFAHANETAGSIPDVYDREAFCNLLDILLVLCGPTRGGFKEARQFKQVYEYSRMISTLEVGGCRSKYPRSVYMTKQHYLYNTKVDSAVETMSGMSPHAVLCIGKNRRFLNELNNHSAFYSLLPMRGEESMFREFLKKINPRPPVETRLYVVKELTVERQKLHELISKKGCCSDTRCCSEEEPCCCS